MTSSAGKLFRPERVKGISSLVRGDPLQAGGTLGREDALVYRAGLLNKSGPLEVTLRDKLNNFAHLLTKVGNSEEIFLQRQQQLVLGLPLWKTYAHHK